MWRSLICNRGARVLLANAPPEEHEEHLSLMLTLQLNLMEGYITVDTPEPMFEMYKEINRQSIT